MSEVVNMFIIMTVLHICHHFNILFWSSWSQPFMTCTKSLTSNTTLLPLPLVHLHQSWKVSQKLLYSFYHFTYVTVCLFLFLFCFLFLEPPAVPPRPPSPEEVAPTKAEDPIGVSINICSYPTKVFITFGMEKTT